MVDPEERRFLHKNNQLATGSPNHIFSYGLADANRVETRTASLLDAGKNAILRAADVDAFELVFG